MGASHRATWSPSKWNAPRRRRTRRPAPPMSRGPRGQPSSPCRSGSGACTRSPRCRCCPCCCSSGPSSPRRSARRATTRDTTKVRRDASVHFPPSPLPLRARSNLIHAPCPSRRPRDAYERPTDPTLTFPDPKQTHRRWTTTATKPRSGVRRCSRSDRLATATESRSASETCQPDRSRTTRSAGGTRCGNRRGSRAGVDR